MHVRGLPFLKPEVAAAYAVWYKTLLSAQPYCQHATGHYLKFLLLASQSLGWESQEFSSHSASFLLTLSTSLSFLDTGGGWTHLSWGPCSPCCLFVSFSLIIALLRLQIQGSNLEIPQEVWGMPEHLELGLGLFLCPMTGRGCGPEAGWEKGTGRGLWPLVAFFKCCQNDSCSPNFCPRLSDTHQGQGCASAWEVGIMASNGL